MSGPKPNRVYHHYKSGVYIVTRLDIDTDTHQERVTYQHLHSGQTYSRPVADWISEGPDGIERFTDITRHIQDLVLCGLASSRVDVLQQRMDRISKVRSDPKRSK